MKNLRGKKKSSNIILVRVFILSTDKTEQNVQLYQQKLIQSREYSKSDDKLLEELCSELDMKQSILDSYSQEISILKSDNLQHLHHIDTIQQTKQNLVAVQEELRHKFEDEMDKIRRILAYETVRTYQFTCFIEFIGWEGAAADAGGGGKEGGISQKKRTEEEGIKRPWGG
jgi:hypothetical protein